MKSALPFRPLPRVRFALAGLTLALLLGPAGVQPADAAPVASQAAASSKMMVVSKGKLTAAQRKRAARAARNCRSFRKARRAHRFWRTRRGVKASRRARSALRRARVFRVGCRRSVLRGRKGVGHKPANPPAPGPSVCCTPATSANPPVAVAPGPSGWTDTSAPGLRWGVVANTKGRGPGMAQEQQRTMGTGVGWLREEFAEGPNSTSDAVYLEAARRGLRVLPLLQQTNRLPSDVDSYTSMVADFSRRYGPGGDFWTAHPELAGALAPTHLEVYNEPYGDWFGPVEPARYASLLRAAVTRGRQANPRMRFLMAVDWTPGGSRNTWIDDLYAAVPNLNDYFDAVAMHPYSGNRAPDKPGDTWGFQRVESARAALGRHGASNKPFWITEVGWSTCPDDPTWCVSEAQQAEYMSRLAVMARTRYTFIDAVFFYHFRNDEQNPGDAEHYFGLVHDNFTPKPAFFALQQITGS